LIGLFKYLIHIKVIKLIASVCIFYHHILWVPQSGIKTPVGYIDVLTDTKIIEVKQINLWKHALGQVKCYGYYYPDKQKWIYLFNQRDTECEGEPFIDPIRTF